MSSYKSKTNRNKGRSLIESISDYTVIDIETTGLDVKFDEIIELSAVRIRDNVPIAEFTSLVNPNQEVDGFITELTGIDNDMLVDAPKLEEVLPKFLDFLSNDILLGYNVNFDINFIYDCVKYLYNKDFNNDFIDCMRIARVCTPELPHHRLRDMIEHFNIDCDIQHRGLADCKTTYKCYEKLKSIVGENSIQHHASHSNNYKNLRASDIATSNTEFNEDSPLFQKMFVFTGTLERFTRKEALQFVVDNGGTIGDSVTKKTDYLVLANNHYAHNIKDGKSTKQKKAEELILKGQDLKIISENVFYDMIFDYI